jgi:hypothetical protein
MTLYYSASIGGFLDSAIHDSLPDDAKRISRAHHHELLEAQSGGAIIAPDAKGRPIATTLVAIDAKAERARLLTLVKRHAARRITAISPIWRQLNDMRAPDDVTAARFAAIDAVRAASTLIENELAGLAVDQLEAFDPSTHPLWPAE